MKAVRYYGPGNIQVEDIPLPRINGDELLLKVEACAVCGSDLKAYHVGNPRLQPPVVMGHEFTGAVVERGKNILDFKVDDHVVMATSISCGKCTYCKRGLTNLCINLAPVGFSYDGGMAEYMVIPALALKNGHVINVPKELKPDYAALAEPLSCAVNSVGKCNIQKGDTVLVMGAGPMGILNACVAKHAGAEKIIMTEINDTRLKQASGFGFDLLVNSAEEDITGIIMEETKGLGVDAVIVAAPSAHPQEQALSLVRKNGTVCLFASLPSGRSQINIDSRLIHYNEINLTGSSDSTAEHVKKAVDILSDPEFPSGKIVTHVLSLDNILNAFDLMESGEALRVVLKT